jgi:hypothetical protein
MRREFVSALAIAGVNEQAAMALAHHHDSKVHQRYLLAKFRSVPAAALPAVSVTAVTFAEERESESSRILGAGHRFRNQLYRRAVEHARRWFFPGFGAVPAIGRDTQTHEVTTRRATGGKHERQAPALLSQGRAPLEPGAEPRHRRGRSHSRRAAAARRRPGRRCAWLPLAHLQQNGCESPTAAAIAVHVPGPEATATPQTTGHS